MERPYFLLSSQSGNAQVIIDRRKQADGETKAMRERLVSTGCIQKELTEEERQEVLKIGDWMQW